MHVTIHTAKTQLSKLIRRACEGDEVVIRGAERLRDGSLVKIIKAEIAAH